MAIRLDSENIKEDADELKRKRQNKYEEGFGETDNTISNDEDVNELWSKYADAVSEDGEDGKVENPVGEDGTQIGVSNTLAGKYDNNENSQNQQYQQNQMAKVLEEAGAESLKYMGSGFKAFFSEFVKGVQMRTADEIAQFCMALVVVCGITSGVCVGVNLLGFLTEMKFMKFGGPLTYVTATMAINCGLGYLITVISIVKIRKAIENGDIDLSKEPDINDGDTNEYEKKFNDLYNKAYGSKDEYEDDDDGYEYGYDDDEEESSFSELDKKYEEPEEEPEEVEVVTDEEYRDKGKSLVEEIGEVAYVSRKLLLDTMIEFMEESTRNFKEKTEIDKDSDLFSTLDYKLTEAMSYVTGKEMNEIREKLDRAYENKFAYILYYERGKNTSGKLDKFKSEIEAHFRESANDETVVANVASEGRYIRIFLTKGFKGVVTLRDCLEDKEIRGFFEDRKKIFPFIIGINDSGDVEYTDLKNIESILITGQQRSGKSWNVFNLLVQLSAFNTPSQVQFVVVDPKDSVLFNRIGLLPHTIGVHTEKDLDAVLQEIIDVEGPRRIAILKEAGEENIWNYRNNGGEMSMIMVVVDEFVSIAEELEKTDKDKLGRIVNNLITIVTKFPYIGIRALIISHRAQGVIDKTLRNMFGYRACLRGTTETVKETVGTSIDRALKEPGDMALMYSGMDRPQYFKSTTPATSDDKLAKLIEFIARTHMKLNTKDNYENKLEYLEVCCNKDKEEVDKFLNGETKSIRFKDLSERSLVSSGSATDYTGNNASHDIITKRIIEGRKKEKQDKEKQELRGEFDGMISSYVQDSIEEDDERPKVNREIHRREEVYEEEKDNDTQDEEDEEEFDLGSEFYDD